MFLMVVQLFSFVIHLWSSLFLLLNLLIYSRNREIDFEPCFKLEDLNLDVRKSSSEKERINLPEEFPGSER